MVLLRIYCIILGYWYLLSRGVANLVYGRDDEYSRCVGEVCCRNFVWELGRRNGRTQQSQGNHQRQSIPFLREFNNISPSLILRYNCSIERG